MEKPPSSQSSSTNDNNNSISNSAIHIPVEIVSEEEMAFIEAALCSTRALLSSSSCPSRFSLLSGLPSVLSPLRRDASSLHSVVASHSQKTPPDIEDSAGLTPPRSLLHQFRTRRALSVTDITATEWCEKQMEFVLLHGKPEKTAAMKAGSDRHTELEEEVVVKVEVQIKSVEESWAVKFMNFIVGAHQLLFEGLTRELPVLGVVEGIWMIGVIDEIQMPGNEAAQNPFLVDTKTRYKATLPSEAQKRNARLQLMCYKYLWDSIVADNFPTGHFFNHFDLNPQYTLSEDVKKYIATLGFQVKTLEDVVMYFRDTCCLLPLSQDQLLLRYELQADRSLLEEYHFAYNAGWFQNQIRECLRFWLGEREASYVSKGEQWKCRFCTFAARCPMTTASNNKVE